MTNYGPATEAAIAKVVDACGRYGSRSIIALAGVPGTGKSYVGSIATQRFTNEPLLVREIQFHPSFTYEEFVEGMRIDDNGAVDVVPGVFLGWNERALDDPDNRYVLLIEELTRANLSSVLGELMTYIEYRGRSFLTIYSRRPVRVAPNLTIVSTFNPTDRSAVELDAALIRRLRILQFTPDVTQLEEMLANSTLSASAIGRLKKLFESCRSQFGRDYEYLMPFGHGIFADVKDEKPDLNRLWEERIKFLLYRPALEPHPFTGEIEKNYPWRNPGYEEP